MGWLVGRVGCARDLYSCRGFGRLRWETGSAVPVWTLHLDMMDEVGGGTSVSMYQKTNFESVVSCVIRKLSIIAKISSSILSIGPPLHMPCQAVRVTVSVTAGGDAR